MTTVLEQTKTVKPGMWSLRDRIKLLEDMPADSTVPKVVIGILDDMYAAPSEAQPYMTWRLQTPVGYDLGLRITKLIDKISPSDPRRAEQALKLIACIQTPHYDQQIFPIDKNSIDPINAAIALLDIDDPRRTDELLAHIDRIVTDPQSQRAKDARNYWGNHGYMYYSNRASGVTEAINLLPEGEIKVGEAISHLKYLANDAASRGGDFGISHKSLQGCIQSMLNCIPEEMQPTVIDVASAPYLVDTLEGYNAGEQSASDSVSSLSSLLALLPRGKLDPQKSALLSASIAFGEAVHTHHPLMLQPSDKHPAYAPDWRLAGLWHEVALRTQAQEIANETVRATAQSVVFPQHGRSFKFGEAA